MAHSALDIKNKTFKVFSSYPFSSYDEVILSKLYEPFIKSYAKELYLKLAGYVNLEDGFIIESTNLSFDCLINAIKADEDILKKSLAILEAVGLIDTYESESQIVFSLKRILSSDEFVLNDSLLALLRMSIDKDSFEEAVFPLIIRKTSLKDFKKVNHSFQDCFEKVSINNIFKDEALDTSNHGINLSKLTFDIEEYKLNILSHNASFKELNNKDFIDLVKRLAFMYSLTVQDMVEATLYAISNDSVDPIYLKKKVFELYNNQDNKLGFKQIKEDNDFNDKLVVYLNEHSVKDVIRTKWKFDLTATEIDMFNKLLEDTKITVGMLNAVVLKVLTDKNGEVPAYNYFFKIINTMLRTNVKNTKEALEYINKESTTIKKTRKVVVTPEWYKNLNSDEKQSKEVKDIPENSSSNEEFFDLNSFLNPKKGN